MRIWIVLGLALAVAAPLPVLANGTSRVMENPGAHPEGDGSQQTGDMAESPPDGLPFHPATPDEMAERCGAADLQHLIGGPWPVDLPPSPGPVRVYATGDMLTMDFNQDRLNIETNAERDSVVDVRCG